MTKENQEQTSVEEQAEDQEVTELAELEAEGELDVQTEVAEAEQQGEEALAEAEPEEDPIAELREQLAEAQAKADEYLDGWQRSRAEFANFRRRQEQRRKQMDTETKSRLLLRLLPVLDDLELAFQAIPEDVNDSSWVEGLSLVGRKLQAVLEKDGVSVMSVQPGDAFDPNYHEARMYEPSEDLEQGEIVQVLQRGYQLDDTVLRPALVSVSSGKIDEKE